jgi:uncharacterized protein YceH (UPF0502 family)
MESESLPKPEPLTDVEARVIGCLIEKEMTVPDYYPLTLNSLVTACNQTSNRDPIMGLDESQVRGALESLKTRGWVLQLTMAGARVQKFKHTVNMKLPRLEKPGIALLCVLLLRGIQTAGELRQRSERLFAFQDLERVELELTGLMNYFEGPLVVCLPAGAGRRVPAFAQLLTGEPVVTPSERVVPAMPSAAPAVETVDAAWKERIEIEIDLLKAQLARLKTSLGVED